MKTPPLSCPYALYVEQMKIRCSRSMGYCGHQYFKRCKGWWALSDAAPRCKIRKIPDDGGKE